MAKCHKFEYCCGNLEFSSSINKRATIRLPGGGGGGAGFKKTIRPRFWQSKNLALTMCETNILTPSIEKMSALYPWKEIVCPLYMKTKCLPSIHEKQMSSSIHEKKMSALYIWYYHGSRTDLIFVSLSCSGLDGEMSAAKFELQWSSVTEH